MLDPFRRRRPARTRVKARAAVEDAQLDPVALSLAIWLGIVVAATAFVRVTRDAVDAARAAQRSQAVSGQVTVAPAPLAGAMLMAPLGG